MEAPTLLLLNSSADERKRVEKALHEGGITPWLLNPDIADLGSLPDGPLPDAAIVCGAGFEETATAVARAYTGIPILVLAESGGTQRPVNNKKSNVSAILRRDEISLLPDRLRRVMPSTVTRNDNAAPGWTKRLLEAAVGATQDVVIVCDAIERRVITCNPAIQNMLGYTPAELVGDTAECLFPDREAFEEFSEFLQESLEQWGRCDTVLQMMRRDGIPLDVSLKVTALPTGLGLDGWIVGTIRDISQERSAERAVSETREHLESTLDSLQDAVITVDPVSRTILTCNPAVETMFGYAPRELIGSPTESFFADQETYEKVGDDYARALEHGGVYRRKLTLPHRDGHQVSVEMTVSALSETRGWREGIVASVRDVTQQERAEERARLAESVVQNTVEAVMITDLDRRIIEVNPAFERLTGYEASEVIGKKPDFLRSGRHDAAFYERIRRELDSKGVWQGEIWHRRKSGEIFPSMASSAVLRNDEGIVTHYSGIFTDISHHKHVQDRLEYLTRYDTLTGLPNRASFEKLIEEAVKQSDRGQPRAAVLFLDIDHFKTVNETLGHAAGDQLLRDVALRLSQPLKPTDELARLGGDEFGIIAHGMADPRDATTLSKQLLDQLQEPFILEGREIYASASIGISLVPEDGLDARNLMKNADSALFRAKEQGRNNYEFFSREMNVKAFETLVMVNSLRHALERDEFELHYQPRIGASDGRIVGAEALVRWNHPDLGLTMPNKFIGLAEQAGLIGSLGDWVIRSALTTLADWHANGLSPIQVSVNLSTREFAAPELAASLKRQLEELGLDSSAVQLEITESMLMSNPRRVENTLRELQANGVSVVIDDFGTGYSSLNYLKHFPISGLKIDQSFVRGIPGNADDTAITRAIIAIAQSLNLRLTAEGVETEEQAKYLRKHGCHELQGFLFSPAVPADDFRKMLVQRSSLVN